MAERSVERYLNELEEDLRDLPRSRRRELVAEISEHIDSALAETHEPDEAVVRNVLERLGEPEVIAKEARERFAISRPRPGIRETLALILLPIGGIVLPVLGWVAGVVLLWTSPVWTTRDKVVGTLVWPGGLVFPVYVLAFAGGSGCATFSVDGRVTSTTCASPSAIHQVLVAFAWVVILIAPIVTAIYLAQRMKLHTAEA